MDSFRYAREAVDHIEQCLLSHDEMLTKYCAANFFCLVIDFFFGYKFADLYVGQHFNGKTFSMHDQVQFLNKLREFIDE